MVSFFDVTNRFLFKNSNIFFLVIFSMFHMKRIMFVLTMAQKKIEGKEVHRAVAGLLTIHNSSIARRAARMPTKHIKIGLDLRIASEVISDINGLKLFPIYSCGTKMPFKEKVI